MIETAETSEEDQIGLKERNSYFACRRRGRVVMIAVNESGKQWDGSGGGGLGLLGIPNLSISTYMDDGMGLFPNQGRCLRGAPP